MSSEDMGSVYAIAEAKRKGYDIIRPDDNTLLIDIDSDMQYTLFVSRLKRLEEITSYDKEEYYSVSGIPHRHVIITTKEGFNVMERLFLQLWLGSDHIKEFISYRRVLDGDDNPILLCRNGKV